MPKPIDLGKLEKLDLEVVWPDEARDFTPWLSEEDNLSILGNALGMDLELENNEVSVGPFSADILCKDTIDGSWVVIENQIKKTDHSHLGQILTYAAGLGAKTLIWIAAKFTDEHRSAFDWLNEVTVEDVQLFGLEIELWKIGNSKPAPKFNIVSKPNDWSRNVRSQTGGREGNITPHKQLQLEFWTSFKAFLSENSALKVQKPTSQHWLSMSIGRTGIVLSAITSTWSTASETASPELRVEFCLTSDQAKLQFAKLEAIKEQIQANVDLPLTWHNPDNIKSAKVYVRCDSDFTDRSQWAQQFVWLSKYLEKFTQIFGPIVKTL